MNGKLNVNGIRSLQWHQNSIKTILFFNRPQSTTKIRHPSEWWMLWEFGILSPHLNGICKPCLIPFSKLDRSQDKLKQWATIKIINNVPYGAVKCQDEVCVTHYLTINSKLSLMLYQPLKMPPFYFYLSPSSCFI